MSGVTVLLAQAAQDAASGMAAEATQDMKLWLPSTALGMILCSPKVMEVEWWLWMAQTEDALDDLHNHLQV